MTPSSDDAERRRLAEQLRSWAAGSDFVQRVRSAWPDLEVDLDDFFAHVVERVTATRAGDGEPAAWERLHLEDLYLAYACACGKPQALQAFEREVRPELAAALHSLKVPAERHDDLRQELWQKLCVSGERPKILEYSGRGALRYWFRVTAMRLLIDDRRRRLPEERRSADRDLTDLAGPAADPEIEYLKQLYSREFQDAFRGAVQALSPSVRNTLRCYYLERMTIDQIALAFGVHRATAARRVVRAREELLAETRRRLSEQLSLDTAELDSILRLIASRLHVTLSGLLE